MKTYNWLFLTLAAFSSVACNDELEKDLKDVSVTVETNDNVTYDGKVITVAKGTPVKFNIGGEPDNITFFSGETGHNFDYRERVTIDPSQIVSSKLTVEINTQYSGAYDNLFSMYMSEEFPGLYKDDFPGDCQQLKDFTGWTEWVKQEELPVEPSKTVSYEMDMMSHLGKILHWLFMCIHMILQNSSLD